MSIFYTDEATILRAGTKTLRGNTTAPDWDNPARTPTGTCLAIDPLAPTEDADDLGDTVTERLSVVTAPGTILDLRPGDRLEYDGHTYRIQDGFVRLWKHPLTGQPDHQEFVIARTQVGPHHG